MIFNSSFNKLILFIFILSIISCNSDSKTATGPTASKEFNHESLSSKNQLYGTWKISEIDSLFIDDGDLTEIEKRDIKQERRSKLKKKPVLYNFFPDGKASFIEGKTYRGAEWNIEGDKMNFKLLKEGLSQASTEKFSAIKIYQKVGEAFFKARIEGVGEFQFRQIAPPLDNINEDPFYPANNQWRVTAKKSETYKQMRQRLYNYTQHCHYLFKSAMDRQQTKVFASNTASIYKYYDGAIALVDGGKVPSAWMSNYYSPDEAMDAYGMAKKYFKGNILRGKPGGGGGGYVVANEAVFKKLLEMMEKDL